MARRGPVEAGRAEARSAGQQILKEKLDIDIAFTSVLKRAIRTLWFIQDETDRMWVPVERSWRLNERHYGALQGLNKAQTVEKHGEAQVKIWRRSYDIPPPALALDDPRHPRHDPRYRDVEPSLLPATESLKDTLARVLPFWNQRIAPQLTAGRNVLVTAHGNSLRAMVKMLDNRSEADNRRAQHPDRCAAAVRTGRRAGAAVQPVSGRSGRHCRRRRGRTAPDREALG